VKALVVQNFAVGQDLVTACLSEVGAVEVLIVKLLEEEVRGELKLEVRTAR
jgi:hypothetical protein